MQAFFTIKQKTIANGNTVNSELEDGNDYCDSSSDDPSLPLLGQGKAEQTGGGKLAIKTTHTRHKLSLSPLVTGPYMKRASDWELWLRWDKDEPRVHSHVPRGCPRPPEEGSRPAWLS